MKALWIYIYLLFVLFGPKIAGFVDTSILANVCVLFFLKGYVTQLPSFVSTLIIWILIILACYFGVALYYESIDVVFVGRLVRSLCSVLCIYVFCMYFKNVCIDEKIGWLVNVLLVHAVIVVLTATVFVGFQEKLRVINDFGAHVRKFRSTGLMAGFDISGLICNIGLVLVLIREKFNGVKFFIFSMAVLLTSRFSMISLSLILLLYLILFRKENSFFKNTCIALPLIAAGGLGLIILSLTTTGFLIDTFLPSVNVSSNVWDILVWTYSKTDFDQTNSMYFVFPETFFTLLFGLGVYGGTDPGYIRVINCIGLLGLLLIIMWHVFFFYEILTKKICDRFTAKKRNYVAIVFSSVLLFLNMKNSYFFTGTFFELLLYVFYSYLIESDKFLFEKGIKR